MCDSCHEVKESAVLRDHPTQEGVISCLCDECDDKLRCPTSTSQ